MIKPLVPRLAFTTDRNLQRLWRLASPAQSQHPRSLMGFLNGRCRRGTNERIDESLSGTVIPNAPCVKLAMLRPVVASDV